VHERLVEPGVELVPRLPELHQALRRDDPLQRVGDGLEAAFELAVLARPVQVVEHRQHRGEHGERGVLLDHLTVAVDPPLVVDVLSLQPLQVVGERRHRRPGPGQLDAQVVRGRRGARRRRARLVGDVGLSALGGLGPVERCRPVDGRLLSFALTGLVGQGHVVLGT
jgi:hypothetical protein